MGANFAEQEDSTHGSSTSLEYVLGAEHVLACSSHQFIPVQGELLNAIYQKARCFKA